jgi:hypothetical protein
MDRVNLRPKDEALPLGDVLAELLPARRVRQEPADSGAKDSTRGLGVAPVVRSPKDKLLSLYEALGSIVPPRSVSDRTGLWNVCQWIARRNDSGEDLDLLIKEVLIYAQEASNPECRKPGAVFVSLLKRRMAYEPPTGSSGSGGTARATRPRGGRGPDCGGVPNGWR